MNESNAPSGFDFYETLRYFLPGLLLIFLFGYVALPEYGSQLSFSEKMLFGVLIGFIIHSFGMYKWVPGSTKIRKEFHKRAEELLTGVGDVYIIWDTMLLTMDNYERQHFRKYFALGAFKLDMVFVLTIFWIYYISKTIFYVITNAFDLMPFVVLLTLLVIIYVVKDDGLNDLRRAFNVGLMAILKHKETGELEKRLNEKRLN